MGRIDPDDLNPEELTVQLELATNALRYAANYQHHHGALPGTALQDLDYIREYAKRVISANGPSELTAIGTEIRAARRKPRGRQRQSRTSKR